MVQYIILDQMNGLTDTQIIRTLEKLNISIPSRNVCIIW